MHTRDISFDEEVAERSDAHREAFGEPAPLADLQAARLRWRLRLDAAAAAPLAPGVHDLGVGRVTAIDARTGDVVVTLSAPCP